MKITNSMCCLELVFNVISILTGYSNYKTVIIAIPRTRMLTLDAQSSNFLIMSITENLYYPRNPHNTPNVVIH